VSLHGDYRYDELKNTHEELQREEKALRDALIEEMRQRPLIVCGYSGRDPTIMEALHDACNTNGAGALILCTPCRPDLFSPPLGSPARIPR
jgi:hypothetical protein